MPFKTKLSTVSIRGTNKRRLSRTLIFEAKTWQIDVPIGFVSNGANVFWPFSMAIPRDGRYRDAAWIHDYLYSRDGKYDRKMDGGTVYDYSRQTANQMMDEIMLDKELRVKSWRRILIMAGLKIGSRFVWARG